MKTGEAVGLNKKLQFMSCISEYIFQFLEFLLIVLYYIQNLSHNPCIIKLIIVPV